MARACCVPRSAVSGHQGEAECFEAMARKASGSTRSRLRRKKWLAWASVRKCHQKMATAIRMLRQMSAMPPPPGSNTDRPDANYRPARQDSVNPSDVPDGYYDLS